MFEQTFKNIDDILHKDAGCTSELDYTEQSSWLLFLKYLDALEQDKAMEAALHGQVYEFIVAEPSPWAIWAAPRTSDGKIDYDHVLTGDDLREFVDQKLFPYLRGFTQRATGPNTIEYKIGQIFGEIKNKFQSGWLLAGLADKGFGGDALTEMQHMIDAEDSDIFDVLAYVAFALVPLSRVERAAEARSQVQPLYADRQKAFIDFVLAHYTKEGVGELDGYKLAPLLKLRYNNAIADATADLGTPEQIRGLFIGFQPYLYEAGSVHT